MREQGISSAFIISLCFHILFVFAAGIIAQQSRTFRMPSPYVVSLVDVSGMSSPAGGGRQAEQKVEETADKAAAKDTAEPRVVEKSPKKDDALVDDRINALKAKKKLERLIALRKIIDIGSSKSASSSAASNFPVKGNKPGVGGTASGASGGDYYTLVMNKLRQQWITPPESRDLEAIVSIKISRDGSVKIDGFEKNSGSHLFDRSVLNAIAKASPLPPPPQEMEIGVRFRP